MTRRAAVLVLGAAAPLACSTGGDYRTPMNPRTIQEVFAAHRDSLMSVPGVVGIAIGRCGDALCIKVMVGAKTPELERRLPKELEGYAVEVQETGPIQAR